MEWLIYVVLPSKFPKIFNKMVINIIDNEEFEIGLHIKGKLNLLRICCIPTCCWYSRTDKLIKSK